MMTKETRNVAAFRKAKLEKLMKSIRITPANWKATYEAIPKYLADCIQIF